MPTLESTVLKIMKQLKLDSVPPRQQKMLQDAIADYAKAASAGDSGKKKGAQKNLEEGATRSSVGGGGPTKKEAEKILKNTAEMSNVNFDDIIKAINKAGIK